jgi:hypothetical protein
LFIGCIILDIFENLSLFCERGGKKRGKRREQERRGESEEIQKFWTDLVGN